MAVPSVFFLFLSIFGFSAPAKALTPVFESTAAAKVTLGSLASRTQCTALSKQGLGPYTMTGTDATSGDSYSYVTDKNYTQTAQLYEGQESPTQNLSYTTSTGQTYSGRSGVIRLVSSGQITYGNTCSNHETYGSAFGPEIWSEPFPATANQSISFDWAAAGGGDDYEAYGYLVKVSASGNTYDYGSSATSTLVSYGRGQNQGWVTSSGTVPSTGYYRFRFVNGSYDATGGKALGASMYIDSAISVASANTITFAQPADIVTSSSNQTFTVSATATSGLSVTFTSSTTNKCTVGSSTDSSGTSTATVTVLASQTGTCTISANSSANNSYVAAATVSQSFTLLTGATAPTTSGGTSMSGTVEYGETLTAVDGTWGDGGSAVTATTYQWQSCTPSSCTWVNISGATSSTYVVGSDDVAKQIRVAVTKTNSIGSLTANSSASITVPALTSAIVTNLSDTSDSGSLRWAITTANASATINTITFASGNTGTITLTSALPAISDNLTITGAGLTSTIIDGNNLYRPFNISSGKSLTISDMTLKQGQATNGGLVNNSAGTFSATDVRFTGMTAGSAVFNNGGGSVSTLTDTTFDYLYAGIKGDYGSTPTALSQTDSDYTNRTYVYDSVFSNNYYGIYGQRFFKIDNTQFSNNTYAAVLAGLNRQQVTNSTFTSNGTGVYLSSWIPTSWTPGAGNQTVSGNTFNGNTTAIQFANNWTNGANTYNGVSSNSFSTATGNTFGNTADNTNNFLGSGYVESGNTITTTTTTSTTTTTTVYVPPVVVVIPPVDAGPVDSGTTTTVPYQPVLGPNNPGQSDDGGDDNDSSPTGTTLPLVTVTIPETESTTVTLPTGTLPEIGFPVATIPKEQGPTETTIPENWVSTVTTLPLIVIDPKEPETVVVIIPSDDYTVVDVEDNEPITTVILDNILEDTFTTDVDVKEVGAVLDTLLGAELTDTQFDNVLEAVFTEDVSADVFTEALTTMLDADITSEQLTAVLASAFSEDTSAENMVAALESIFDGPISSGDLTTVMDAVFDEDISFEDTAAVLGDLLETNLSQAEAEAVFDNVFDDDLSDAETIDLIVDVLKDGLTAENLGAALGAVFDEEVSTEVLVETFTAVLDGELNEESLGVIVDVLESDTITSEQVGQVVTLVIEQEGGIPSDQATELATSPKVLESIDGSQATEVFAAIVVAEVSQEAGAEIAEALAEAPVEVKESFEEEINVFAGVFDTYTALGSSIDVGTRRSVIAVNLVTSTVALATAAGAIPTPGSNSNPSSPRQDVAARREEEELEEGGAIEGEGPDWIKSISIYKYENGVKTMDWKNFTKKFIYGVMGSGFTLAGATVMYFTLSGLTQQIALWGTLIAFTCAMYLHMKEPEN